MMCRKQLSCKTCGEQVLAMGIEGGGVKCILFNEYTCCGKKMTKFKEVK